MRELKSIGNYRIVKDRNGGCTYYYVLLGSEVIRCFRMLEAAKEYAAEMSK